MQRHLDIKSWKQINVFRDDSMSESQMRFWYQCFKLGSEVIQLTEHQNAEYVQATIKEN